LSWRQLAEGAVRPGRVVVPQVLGQHLAQVALIDDQQAVEDLPALGADGPLADRVRSGACGGLARILAPSAVNTASKELACGIFLSRASPITCPARKLGLVPWAGILLRG